MDFDARLVLRDEHGFAERRNTPVVRRLGATIVCFRRVGEHFNEKDGIDDGILVFGVRLETAAYHAGGAPPESSSAQGAVG